MLDTEKEFAKLATKEEERRQNDEYMKHWRSWGSWFSWGSATGFSIFLVAVGIFIVLVRYAWIMGR